MSCERTVAINQPAEISPGQRPIYSVVQELPVTAIAYLLPTEISPWTSAICGDVLRHWKAVGFVVINDKDRLIEVIQEQYRDTPKPIAEKLVGDLIKEGMFREEEGWLIPLKPMLSCATDREVKPNPAWWCYIPSFSNVSISLSKVPVSAT